MRPAQRHNVKRVASLLLRVETENGAQEPMYVFALDPPPSGWQIQIATTIIEITQTWLANNADFGSLDMNAHIYVPWYLGCPC